MRALAILFRREIGLAWTGGGPLLALAFYACVATLLPLAIGAGDGRLSSVAHGAAWLALALASLLSLERMFERDFEDGALDLIALGPAPLEAVCLVKCLAQWAAIGLPLAAAAPAAAAALGAPLELAPLIAATAAVGGVGLYCVGGTGAALALGSRRGGVLTAVVVLPLFAPPVIFGAGAVEALSTGLNWGPALALLAAYSLAASALAPFAMAAAVRNALD